MVERVDRQKLQEQLFVSLLSGQAQEFFFPEGLLGFSGHRRFTLSRYQPVDGSDSPFFLLQSTENTLSFPLISPRLLVTDYQIFPTATTLVKLATDTMDDLAVLVIVTLRDRVEEITANLQGPLLLNPLARLGMQFIAEQYPVRHPLLQCHSPMTTRKRRRQFHKNG